MARTEDERAAKRETAHERDVDARADRLSRTFEVVLITTGAAAAGWLILTMLHVV